MAPLLVAGAIGRLPYGMNILALVLLLRAEGFSYAEVGLVSGAGGLAVGLTAPLLGRAVDRLGPSRVLAATAVVSLAADSGLVVAALSGAGVASLAALAFLQGASTPPISPSMRMLWPKLVGRERLDTAFAYDALQLELFFITGPLLVVLIADAASPAAAFLTGVVLQASGALAFALAPAARRRRPVERVRGALAGALAAPGMRIFVAALALAGVSIGALEIGVPAFAEHERSRGDAGWLFALWAAGSLAGGVWYGARQWRLAARRRYLVLSGALGLGMAPLPFAGSLPVFGVLIVVAGLALAPVTAAAYSVIEELAVEGSAAEAFAWQTVSAVLGGACGAWLAGVLVEALSVEAALALAPVAAGCGWLVAFVGIGRSA